MQGIRSNSFFADDEDLYRGAIELIDDAVDVTQINPNEAKPAPAEIKDEFCGPQHGLTFDIFTCFIAIPPTIENDHFLLERVWIHCNLAWSDRTKF